MVRLHPLLFKGGPTYLLYKNQFPLGLDPTITKFRNEFLVGNYGYHNTLPPHHTLTLSITPCTTRNLICIGTNETSRRLTRRKKYTAPTLFWGKELPGLYHRPHLYTCPTAFGLQKTRSPNALSCLAIFEPLWLLSSAVNNHTNQFLAWGQIYKTRLEYKISLSFS